MEKKLSICFLVYNQSKELEEVLRSIVPQMTDEVEILVKDDSVDDSSERVVMDFRKKGVPISYFRGEKKGIDRAILFAADKASGEFVWFMGDDDITQGSIKKILDVIHTHHVSFIWANYRLHNETRIAIDIPEDGILEDKDELLLKGGTSLGFCSAAIMRRENLMKRWEEAHKYAGGEFVNLFFALAAIASGSCYYLREPVVICYPNTSEEIKKRTVKGDRIVNRAFEVFGVNFANLLWEFEGTFSKHAIRKAIKSSFGQTWRGVLVGAVGGWDTTRGKRLRMIKYFWSYPECWIALPLFCLPLWMIKGLYRGYKLFFNERKWRWGRNNRVATPSL